MSSRDPHAGAARRPEKLHPPIIDYDLPCPQCGYNLYGLAELRCPECGVQFESMQILATVQRCEWPAPGLMRVLRTIYLHPLAFWDMPAMRVRKVSIPLMPAGGGGIAGCDRVADTGAGCQVTGRHSWKWRNSSSCASCFWPWCCS